MKKRNKAKRSRVSRATRSFRTGVLLAAAVLTAGAVTAITRHESGSGSASRGAKATEAGKNLVTVEVAGKNLQVDARTLQQGPLTQDQALQIADALKDNKSSDGLVQIRQANGSLSMDLRGRFQDVVIARKNDDGSVSQACVDNSKAATTFLENRQGSTASVPGGDRKGPVEIQ